VRTNLHVGELEADRLVLADRTTEGLAGPGIRQRLVEAALRQADGEGGDRDSSLVENLEELRVATPLLPDEVVHRNPAVVEGQPMSVRSVPTDLRVGGRHGEPRRV
jgi:hypothetical protein